MNRDDLHGHLNRFSIPDEVMHETCDAIIGLLNLLSDFNMPFSDSLIDALDDMYRERPRYMTYNFPKLLQITIEKKIREHS